MSSLTETAVGAIKSGALPLEANELLRGFLSEDGQRFDAEEGTYWDYKKEFPFSLKSTDPFFAGIARLVVAFNNTYGGLIIFGVHDSTRKPGQNKVLVDIERFNSRLREVLSMPVECVYRQYNLRESDDVEEGDDLLVDVVLVPKRPAGSLVRLNIPYKGAQTGQVWIRRGPEVVEADSSDFTWLYGPRADYGLEQTIADARIDAILPPSPATMRKFVGRSEVLDRLFQWLLLDDNEPRMFLYGSGGSGKSTIAYEFARLVQLHGQSMVPLDGTPISSVLYFSAKETRLDSNTGKITPESVTDFATKRELFEWIIQFGEGHDSDLSTLTEMELDRRIKKVFDERRLLIVIDDIDTLLTKGEAAGLDSLYKSAIRGRCGAKLLYTQRPLPSLSRENSIEVPGLRFDSFLGCEYHRFVETCCSQFGLNVPNLDFVNGPLSFTNPPLSLSFMSRICASVLSWRSLRVEVHWLVESRLTPTPCRAAKNSKYSQAALAMLVRAPYSCPENRAETAANPLT